MPIETTCIGAYPKPDFIHLPDWFNIPAGPDTADPTMGWASALAAWAASFSHGVDPRGWYRGTRGQWTPSGLLTR